MGGVLAKTKFKRSQCATSLTERFPDKGAVNRNIHVGLFCGQCRRGFIDTNPIFPHISLKMLFLKVYFFSVDFSRVYFLNGQ